MNFVGAPSLDLLLANIVLVAVGAEAVVPVGAEVPIPIEIAAALYITYQFLQASFTKYYNYIFSAPILGCTELYNSYFINYNIPAIVNRVHSLMAYNTACHGKILKLSSAAWHSISI